MAIQTGPIFLQGTYGNICAYRCSKQWRFRQKSTLTAKRVKTSPHFRNTMLFAGLMARSSAIGSAIYKELPAHWKQFWMYRAFVGEAMTMLKEGKTHKEALEILWKRYAAEFAPGYREEQEFVHKTAAIRRLPKYKTYHRPPAPRKINRSNIPVLQDCYEELLL